MTEPTFFGAPDKLAADLARGICRLFKSLGYSSVLELTLANGRRVDVAALSGRGDIHVVEIKSSVADFRADQKWPEYLEFCDAFYFGVSCEFPLDLLPEDVGVIIADKYGAEIIRDAPEDRLGAARRKAVMLRFAHAAATRLQNLSDPDAGQ
jgi:hypothetical protein